MRFLFCLSHTANALCTCLAINWLKAKRAAREEKEKEKIKLDYG